MTGEPFPTYEFVLVVVREGDRFLLIQESDQLWYLPAGRVKNGETLTEAAKRETLEESGLPVELDGIVRVEHTVYPEEYVRFRIFFTAHPLANCSTKLVPDEHSLAAAWVRASELSGYPLRDEEVRRALEYVAGGGVIYPMSLLTVEGAPFEKV